MPPNVSDSATDQLSDKPGKKMYSQTRTKIINSSEKLLQDEQLLRPTHVKTRKKTRLYSVKLEPYQV